MKHTVVEDDQVSTILQEQRSEISGYAFHKVNFTEFDLKSSLFIDCVFVGCNLANMSLLNVSLRAVLFEDCNLMGTNWTEIRKGGDFNFAGCKLDYACFQAVDLRGVQFTDCTIREADFSGANLTKSSFARATLSGTSFSGANLEKADFRAARQYFIDPKFTKIKEAVFSFPEALVLVEALGAKVEL